MAKIIISPRKSYLKRSLKICKIMDIIFGTKLHIPQVTVSICPKAFLMFSCHIPHEIKLLDADYAVL